MRRSAVTLLIGILLSIAAAAAPEDPAAVQRDLEELRGRLQELEQELEQQTDRRAAVVRELRDAEQAEAAARSELASLRSRLEASRQRLATLEQEMDRNRRELATEVEVLERQVRAAFMSGQQEWLRLVLSGEDPQLVGRRLVYFGYLSQARSALVNAVRERLAGLMARAEAVEAESKRLATLESEQARQLAALDRHRSERAAVLARVDEGIEGREKQLDRLRGEAEALEALVQRLSRALADLPIGDAAPFAERKGGMNWPVDGRPVRHFGQARADGRLRWEGALLEAAAGSEVRAVHHGRVVFADWLPGLGLLAVLEHGDGYLSLYGHNQDLVKDVGDWVATGEVLAHVGDSGGRARAGLYFEIRKDGRPVDPRPWIR